MARKFFYVCGGVFMLALAYHVGAMKATAQTSGTTAYGIDMGGNISMVAVNRTIFWMNESGQLSSLLAVPGTSPIVAIGSKALPTGGGALAILQDGEIYRKGSQSPSWLRIGNLYGSGTAARTASWGAVKARYR